jgi:hypothetical protein
MHGREPGGAAAQARAMGEPPGCEPLAAGVGRAAQAGERDGIRKTKQGAHVVLEVEAHVGLGAGSRHLRQVAQVTHLSAVETQHLRVWVGGWEGPWRPRCLLPTTATPLTRQDFQHCRPPHQHSIISTGISTLSAPSSNPSITLSTLSSPAGCVGPRTPASPHTPAPG